MSYVNCEHLNSSIHYLAFSAAVVQYTLPTVEVSSNYHLLKCLVCWTFQKCWYVFAQSSLFRLRKAVCLVFK